MKKVLVISNQLSSNDKDIVNPVVRNLNDALTRKGLFITEHPVNNKNGLLFEYIRLIRFLLKSDTSKFDVIHVHFGGLQGLIAALVCRGKTIVSFHGTDLHGGTPKNLINKIKSKIVVACSKMSVVLCKQCTVVSSNLIPSIPKKFVSKVTVIPTGVDTRNFIDLEKVVAKKTLGLGVEKKYILFSDISGSKVKRRDIAEKAIELLCNNGFNVELLVMNKVHYSDVPKYIFSSEFLLLTSDKEGSPNIVKEVLYCGKPVMSTDVGDVKEYVNKTNCGLIFKSNSPYEISRQIERYLLGEVKFIRLESRNELSIDYIADMYKVIYENQ